MDRIVASTSRVVPCAAVYTDSSLRDLCYRMGRRFLGKYGRTTPFRLEIRSLPRSYLRRLSDPDCLVTMHLLEGTEWPSEGTDGDMANNPEAYKDWEKRRRRRTIKCASTSDAEQ